MSAKPVILITGGAGFIGSNVVAHFADEADVVVCDRLGDDERWRNLARHDIADLLLPDQLEGFLASEGRTVESVIHMGAVSSTTETDLDLIVRSNYTLSRDLWNWCARKDVRYLYASSAATYGAGEAGFVDDESPQAMARLKPLNAYGWSKHLFDRFVLRTVNAGGPRPPQWAGLKFFNVYGPNEYHKGSMKSVVAQLYPGLAAGEPARLFRSHHPDYEDGRQLRDFIWVGDCVRVVDWLYRHPRICGLFNVGTGKARAFADLARAVFSALERETEIVYVDTPAEIRDKYQYFTQADMTKLRQAGYDEPFTELEAGVADYVRNYLATDDPHR